MFNDSQYGPLQGNVQSGSGRGIGALLSSSLNAGLDEGPQSDQVAAGVSNPDFTLETDNPALQDYYQNLYDQQGPTAFNSTFAQRLAANLSGNALPSGSPSGNADSNSTLANALSWDRRPPQRSRSL